MFVVKNVLGHYVDRNGGGRRKLYYASLALEELADKKYKVIKDRNGIYGVDKIITEDELFLEIL